MNLEQERAVQPGVADRDQNPVEWLEKTLHRGGSFPLEQFPEAGLLRFENPGTRSLEFLRRQAEGQGSERRGPWTSGVDHGGPGEVVRDSLPRRGSLRGASRSGGSDLG